MARIVNPTIVMGTRNNRTTRNPQYGDVVYLRPDGQVVFIKLDTLNTSQLPNTWVAVGYVEEPKNEQNKVLICEKNNASYKAADVFRFKVVPQAAVLDGAEHTVAVKLHNADQPNFTFTANNEQEYATALNTYLRASVTSYTYWAYYDTAASCIYMFLGNYTSYEGDTNTIGSATVSKWIYSEITANSSLRSATGTISGNTRSSYWQMLNRDRCIEFLTTTTSGTFNPATFSYGMPVSYICWQTAVCNTVRAQYEGAGYSGKAAWIKYLDDNFTCNLDAAGTATADEIDPLTGASRRSGYANTYALANVTYKDINGVEKPLYPGIRYAADCNYNADGLRAGNWFVSSLYEGFKADSKVTYGLAGVTRATADKGNQALLAIGGTAISCAAYHWFSSRYSTSGAWDYNGNGGSGSGGFCGSFIVRRFSLLEVL